MKLVIVESPTKAKTLSRFLTADYKVRSTMGHIRDLPKKKLGVEIEKNFKPQYALVPGKKEAIEALKEAAQKAKEIILATDPDREGEAIAWHTAQILGGNQKPKTKNQKLISRIVFHQITKGAILAALEKPKKIDMDLVDAQQARRILDRLVGYKLSPLLWKKIRRGLSAGRVQSVAVRLIVEREREIENFAREEYWRILGAFKAPEPEKEEDIFTAELIAKDGESLREIKKIRLFSGEYTSSKTTIGDEGRVEDTILDLTEKFLVEQMDVKESRRNPPPPLTTSTLQQTAGYRLGFSSKLTMTLAQSLYENGLITYHRTDSLQVAAFAIGKIRDYVKEKFGEKYLAEKARVYKTRSKVAQEAHEAIRPTRIETREPKLETRFGEKAGQLYELIWRRTVATQMAAARIEKTDLEISCGGYRFASQGLRLLFEGFAKVWPVKLAENFFPHLEVGDELKAVSLGALKEKTVAPPRYNEARLVATLEKEGIGRPSTYAPIISTIQARRYTEKEDGFFVPTNLGTTVNDFLVDYFSNIVDIPFTVRMEEDLDEIAQGEEEWQEVMADFWGPFEQKLASVEEVAERRKIPVKATDKRCPKCEAMLVERIGRFGKFLACSKFPECKYTERLVEKLEGMKCPKCKKGEVIIKKTRKGKRFYGCSRWPKCDWASWRKPTFDKK